MREYWYARYESQCWYKNTFLVDEFDQISKVKKEDDWNNIEGSGCHFVCLAMILEVNPAYLASKLKDKGYFSEDAGINAINLKGEECKLVWDRNKPFEEGKKGELKIDDVYIQGEGMVSFTIRLKVIEKPASREHAIKIIKKHKNNGDHIIFGYSDHSRLIAGKGDDDFLVWDPDTSPSATSEENNIKGKLTLNWFYSEYSNNRIFKDETPEYWVYSVDKRIE